MPGLYRYVSGSSLTSKVCSVKKGIQNTPIVIFVNGLSLLEALQADRRMYMQKEKKKSVCIR